MVFLPPNAIFLVITLAVLKVLCISARPLAENSFNAGQERRYSKPPIGSDTFNPGTLSHPATVVVDPPEAILDASGLWELDGHDEGPGNINEEEGPLDKLAAVKVRTQRQEMHASPLSSHIQRVFIRLVPQSEGLTLCIPENTIVHPRQHAIVCT